MGGQRTPDDGLLIEFVQRLIADQFPGGPTSVQVFVGRFPDEPDISVPRPPDSRLLGTAVHRRMGQVALLEAVFDAPASPAETLTKYEEVLRARGWQLAREFGPSGPPGFLTAFVGHWRTYQQAQQGPVLVVNALPLDANGTDLRLRFDWEMPRLRPPGRHSVDPGLGQMPPLLAPPDVILQPRGRGTNSSWIAEASTRSEKPPAELESYLGAQLKGLGWTRLTGEVTDRLAWSSWSLPGTDNAWRGLLVVISAFPGECSLSLLVERPGEPPDSGPPSSRRWPRS